MTEIIAIDTPSLGDRSYLAHDGTVAVVIDPQRDIDRVLDLAAGAGVTITHVFETHVHNDYVTGGFALAEATGAAYHVSAADNVAFRRVPVADGPAGADLSLPHRADAAELLRRIEAGEWVADLRSRTAFAAGHVAGSLSFPLDSSFATYLGWLIPWGTPLILLGDAPGQVAEAQRELARIGMTGPPQQPPAARITGRAGSRCAATPPPPSPAWPQSAATARSSRWTCAGTWNGPGRTSTARCTSPSTSCPPA